MKKIFSSLLILFSFTLAIGFSSCKDDLCDKTNCAYSGLCDRGVCICQVGYESVHCEVIARDKFVKDGVYSVSEKGTFTPTSNYTAIITTGDRINEVKLKNLRNGILAGGEVVATVSHDTMWIAAQDINGYRIEGSGIITGQNPVSGADLYLDASIELTYKTTRLSDNVVDYYGTNGANTSVWDKN